MEAIASNHLILKSFKILEFNFQTIISEERQRLKKINFNKFSIDFDFEIFAEEEKTNLNFIIEAEIIINKEKKDGYFIAGKFLGEFQLKQRKKLTQQTENQYILYSALPMVISQIRFKISNLTYEGFYGQYILPAIDLQQLIKKKLIND